VGACTLFVVYWCIRTVQHEVREKWVTVFYESYSFFLKFGELYAYKKEWKWKFLQDLFRFCSGFRSTKHRVTKFIFAFVSRSYWVLWNSSPLRHRHSFSFTFCRIPWKMWDCSPDLEQNFKWWRNDFRGVSEYDLDTIAKMNFVKCSSAENWVIYREKLEEIFNFENI
jgi:hypothetical protein